MVEVLTEIAKFCDIYLMERILDDESGVCSNLTFSFSLKELYPSVLCSSALLPMYMVF